MPASTDTARPRGEDYPLGTDAPQPGPVWAIITGQAAGTNRYSWKQLNDGDTSTFGDSLSDNFAAQGGTGETAYCAYEINGRQDVPTGGTARVRVWPAGDMSFVVFEYAGGGATVQEVDGSPSYTGTTTFRFDQTDGFVVSQPAAGIARIDIASATVSQAGIVSTGIQTWAGYKYSTSGFGVTDLGAGGVTLAQWVYIGFPLGICPGLNNDNLTFLYLDNGQTAAGLRIVAVGASINGVRYSVGDLFGNVSDGLTGTLGVGAVATGGIITALGSGDLAVADGGTGASTAGGARTNLGLVIGTDVQAWSAALNAVTGTNTGDQDLSSYETIAGAAAAYQPVSANLTALAAVGTRFTGTRGIGGETYTWTDGILESVV